MRNWLQASDRSTEMSMQIRQSTDVSQSNNSPDTSRAMITTNPEFFITDALELIEDDQANNTILVGEDSGDDEKNQDVSMVERKDQDVFAESYDVPKVLWDIEKVADWSKRIASYSAE